MSYTNLMAYNGGVNRDWALNTIRMSVAVNNSVNFTTLNWCPTCGVCNNYNLLIDSYFMNRSDEASSGPMCFCTADLLDASLLGAINQIAYSKSAGPFATLLDGMNWVRTNGIFVTNQNYPSIVTSGGTLNLDAGLPASYPMVGTNWYDLTGNNNNTGTLLNGITYNSTLKGFLTFNGSNQYVSFTTPTNIPIGNSNYTISVWFNADTLGDKGLVGWGNYSSTNEVNAFKLTSSGLSNYWLSNDLSVTTTITTGLWYNAVATFDGTTRSIWVNGTLINSDTPTGHDVPNANNLTIGVTNTSEYFDGSIGEVQIFNRGLFSDEILNNYNTLLTRYNGSNTEICVSPIYCVTQTPTPTPTPTDVSACIPQTIYNAETFSVLMQNSYSSFNPDGTQVYFTRHNTGVGSGTGYDPIIMYNLGTAWDVSTIIANGYQTSASGTYAIPAAVSINTDTVVSSVQGHCFSPDGTKIFVCNASTGVLRGFTLSTPWNITTMTFTSSGTTYGASLSVVKFTPDGLTMTLLGTGGTKQYSLNNPWDIVGGTLISTASGNVSDIDFQNNGLYLFTFNSSNNLIRKTLSSPYNITGVTATQTLNLTGGPYIGSVPRIDFKNGYKGFISSYNGNAPAVISAFELTCNYDISGSLVVVPTPTPTPTMTSTPTMTLTPTQSPTQTNTPTPTSTPQYRFLPGETLLGNFIDNGSSAYFYGDFTGYSENNVVPAGRIIKLNQDLTIDYSFTGGTGFVSPYSYMFDGESIIQQSDGKIIATGFFTSYSGVSKNHIVRLNVDGSIDDTFVIGSGFENGDYPEYTGKAGIDSLGNIMVPGNFGTYNGVTVPMFGLTKLSSGGTMDMTFSATTGFAGAPTFPQGVLVNPDDSMYVTGYFTSFSGISANKIIKLQSNGYKDDSFNYGTGFNSTGDNPLYCFRIPGETSFYVIGSNFTEYNGVSANNIIKLNSDGTVDYSFTGGTGFDGGLGSSSCVIWTDKLLMMGDFTSYDGVPSIYNIILNSDGTIFQTFIPEYYVLFVIGNKLYGSELGGPLILLMTYP